MEDSQFESPEAASKSVVVEVSNLAGLKVLSLKVPTRALPPTLITLPPELRRKIYTYTLSAQISPYHLRHVSHCPLRSRTDASEPPPFINSRLTFPYMGTSLTMEDLNRATASCKEINTHRCACAKRHHGLGLLLVCRKVHREAVGVFYSSNTFYFTNGYEFLGFYYSTRPELRNLIKGISIVDPESPDASVRLQASGKDALGTLWNTLLGLEGLETLEFRPEHVLYYGIRVMELWDKRDVEITLVLVRHSPQLNERLFQDIWIKVGEPLQKTTTRHVQKHKAAKAIRDQSEWFRVIVRKCQVSAREKLASMLDERRKDLNVTLDSIEVEIQLQGEMLTKTIELMGQPNTTSVRLQLAKDERRYNADRIARGLRTRTQEDVYEKVQERQKNSAATKLAEEEYNALRRENDRILDQEWSERRRPEEEERLKGARKKEVEGRRKSALGYRQKERKRVSSPRKK
ncbi:hypothetical protein BJ875DRAFT_544097 [Amylocarpus encephaloides]|uniref:DUF7730 domain-containing protein n=1 Tax=Amylocarpus encephaloides TaxID=45428 RepID=A0A9P7YG16_9HELO|nr:hypothetical protein BJ875DRAFT_544097 [Amylocarpus encephaloides]